MYANSHTVGFVVSELLERFGGSVSEEIASVGWYWCGAASLWEGGGREVREGGGEREGRRGERGERGRRRERGRGGER